MGEVGIDSKLICVPGQRLCLTDENTIAGSGTYERHGYIYSMLSGVVVISEKEKVKYETNEGKHWVKQKLFFSSTKFCSRKSSK